MTALLISLVLTPSFSEPGVAPRLVVKVENQGKAEVPLEVPLDDACFVAKFLAMSLATPGGKGLAPAACPQHETVQRSLPRRAIFERGLDLGVLFPTVDWSAGKYALTAHWRAGMQQQSSAGLDFVRAKALGVVKVKRGETVVLPGGEKLTFVAHGHKRTHEGQRSPLLVSAKLDGHDANASLDDGERVFELGGLTFELLSHGYDTFMELRCFGRVER